MDILLIEQRIKEFVQKLSENSDISQRTNLILESIEKELFVTDRELYRNYYNDLCYIRKVLEQFQKTGHKPPIADIPFHFHGKSDVDNSDKQSERQLTIRKFLDDVINSPVRTR